MWIPVLATQTLNFLTEQPIRFKGYINLSAATIFNFAHQPTQYAILRENVIEKREGY